MICQHGPFTFYRRPEAEYISITLTRFDNEPFGWEMGWEDPMAKRKPLVELRVGRLIVFSFEKFKKGFEVWFLGFWLIK